MLLENARFQIKCRILEHFNQALYLTGRTIQALGTPRVLGPRRGVLDPPRVLSPHRILGPLRVLGLVFPVCCFRKRNQKRWWQVQQIISNSGFVSIKFNLSLPRFYFSVFFRRSRYQTKQNLAVTFLFQCNFPLVVGADNLIYQFYFYFYRILLKRCWINIKVFIGFSIFSACKQTFPVISRVNFIVEE